MRVLIIGGTRNVGHLLSLELLSAGHAVTVCNRGVTPDELPGTVERLRADRTDRASLAAALAGGTWDAVIDTALYTGAEAGMAVELLEGRTGHYVLIGTGQVYLVRDGAPRPAREEDAEGPILPPPPAGSPDHSEWQYGIGKREAEAVLTEARARSGFPFTTLRLPMIHSPRDHYGRLHNYFLRLRDGGPLLVPDDAGLSVRHVWAGDVVRAVVAVLERGGRGEAFNVGQDETLTHDECLALLADVAGVLLRVVRLPRATLATEGLLPACAPFSGTWMSSLDNTRAREVLGLRPTPMREYLTELALHYADPGRAAPAGYAQRAREMALAAAGGVPT